MLTVTSGDKKKNKHPYIASIQYEILVFVSLPISILYQLFQLVTKVNACTYCYVFFHTLIRDSLNIIDGCYLPK